MQSRPLIHRSQTHSTMRLSIPVDVDIGTERPHVSLSQDVRQMLVGLVVAIVMLATVATVVVLNREPEDLTRETETHARR